MASLSIKKWSAGFVTGLALNKDFRGFGVTSADVKSIFDKEPAKYDAATNGSGTDANSAAHYDAWIVQTTDSGYTVKKRKSKVSSAKDKGNSAGSHRRACQSPILG
ncbi:hypothetical protein K469DRAFT_693089 [Zopfia rhizophila CBS 207.26]|uniref:Uncharacterized protein n=1 Tax=Zopfia rhizophila CBS 207.26 TaxID=1314779 RepID=A0A6A6ENZ5_9PEZI|nr:hypothetical protein K469DRAFT_693089 [Zopfia rhizophila CBS 207.26]